ncbi:hypothetical protein [Phenylobacterium sp. J367]|uniref:hypothetical protein n=1 Tax=Phenylobacterium sp. J367 TaxID=2898435 RepID=UPI002150AA9C|nr:hypothetical protein [Phenylobacterium sp. J367]MCR5879282.1 hypothetical protein [Phenylobacterium sp. J367]
MKTFVIRENIRHYQHVLQGQLDPEQRRTAEALLAEEEAALLAAMRSEAPLPPRDTPPTRSAS